MTEAVANLHRFIVNDLKSGVVAIDSEDRVAAVNPAAHQHLGLAPGTITVGEPLASFEALRPFLGIVEKMKASGEAISRHAFVLREETIASIEIGVSASLLEGPDAYNGGILLFTDMTERRKLERAAAINQQLASLGELAAGVVHELRNPLTIISGRAELLLRNVDGDDKARKNVSEIINEARLLERAIAQFLGFSRPFEIKMAHHAVTDIVGRTLQLCSRRADRRSVELIPQISEAAGEIFVDGDRVAEALANIVANAIDAVDEGGRVTIGARGVGSNFVFEVTDNGPGIELKPGEDLFSPFFTMKRDGTGLGLSIVQRIISAHEGSVAYENRPEGGARFEVTVPITLAAATTEG
jgi:signal transduction histidine kinase